MWNGIICKDWMASPSGSRAVTVKLTVPPGATNRLFGALTIGGRSTLMTWITVLAVPERAFEARKLTL